ncbi:crAss001_48 related protein [Pseudomonas aeruginosa]|uniref:crAss001_48 related protein n=3 Tax=Pseudomonas aeruginosa TaxID=287 RepID=UPI0003BB27A1|nr:hypothetical protein [Pseudomonas aeruginosa]ERZ12384.1 hypothetical protein Q008_04248 [Pseudomonas aeruginosa JJ692]MCM6742778.1 hypothetical protein [Pseudomonas aeruginosa]MCT0922911.1 hypothetical protein [Pseudomonas aeruginosa]MCT5308616.1 hypothetical protein [Pseudomonas aeruginosa]MCV6272761.1 hypothetical protein [Pseudomonas aeruginosa]
MPEIGTGHSNNSEPSLALGFFYFWRQEMTQSYIGTKQILAWEQDRDGQPGYAVKYADGYMSWSPKDVFEAAYLPIGHIGHLLPHQQRIVGEKVQLDDKVDKLSRFLGGEFFRSLESGEQERLTAQLGAMREYQQILAERIAAF